jgi:hypothetical protein
VGDGDCHVITSSVAMLPRPFTEDTHVFSGNTIATERSINPSKVTFTCIAECVTQAPKMSSVTLVSPTVKLTSDNGMPSQSYSSTDIIDELHADTTSMNPKIAEKDVAKNSYGEYTGKAMVRKGT